MQKLTLEQKSELINNFEKPLMYGRPFPYVLFGFMSNRSKNKKRFQEPKTFCLDVSGHHRTKDSIENYLGKGFEILDYSLPEATPENMGFWKGADPYSDIRGYLARSKYDYESASNTESENSALKKELAKMKKEIEKNGSR